MNEIIAAICVIGSIIAVIVCTIGLLGSVAACIISEEKEREGKEKIE